MAMNFFQAQDHARRNTWFLILLFTAAVALTIAIVYFAAMLVNIGGADDSAADLSELNYDLLLDTAIAVLLLVSVGSLYKAFTLYGGGEKVAESMGGRLLLMPTRDANERRLINIVEEIAIAAGAPMPQIYVLPDASINAFAAGTTPGNAVIGITKGALQQLSREQVQGVIAHEFSHIMNGDMRLNIRLIAIIHGIMILGYLGYFILRGSLYGSMVGRGRREGGGQIVLIGIALIIAGSVGTFFGSLIRAAVSRQREYLADAAAVQYTRNPRGIAGALERIGLSAYPPSAAKKPKGRQAKQELSRLSEAEAKNPTHDNQIESGKAIEYSHMFFSNAVAAGFANPFATHPPLHERIRRIMPQLREGELINEGSAVQSQSADSAVAAAAPPAANPLAAGFSAAAGIGHIGTVNAESVQYAGELLKQIPPQLMEATQEPYAARALIYALLLDKKHEGIRNAQMAHLAEHADQGVHELVIKLKPLIERLQPMHRLPLVQCSLPALRQLSLWQYKLFTQNMAGLIAADSAVELFEWCIQAVVVHALHDHFSRHSRAVEAGDKNQAMAYALSILARVGQEQPQAAFADAAKNAGLSLSYSPADFNPQELFTAMQQIAVMPPKRKKNFVHAAMACASHNGFIDADEAALLRAYFMIIDCPLPLTVVEGRAC